jgi:N-methylhydantoinase B
MPGGAGFGAAAERDPAAIERDLAAGVVTPAGALADYGYAGAMAEAAS